MTTLTATNARSNIFKLLKKSIKDHLPIRITSKEGTAIIISEEDYENLMETAELLSVPGFKESIKKADKEIKKREIYSMEKVFKK